MRVQRCRATNAWVRGVKSAALLVLSVGGLPPVFAGASPAHDPQAWPGFRGVDGLGVAQPPSASLPGPRKVGLRVAWKVPIGSGYSGVSLDGRRAVTMYADGARDVIAAFDIENGGRVWRFDIDETYKGHDGSHDGPISTPLLHDGCVYGLSPRGRFFALKLADGSLIWSRQLVEDGVPKPHYGFCTSPMMIDGTLVIQVGEEAGAVAGFDPKTGERRWTAGADSIQYQSGVPGRFEGRNVALSAGGANVLAVDADGKLCWSFAHEGAGGRGAASLTPVQIDDDRFFLAHHDDRSKLVRLTRGRGGEIEPETLWETDSIRNSYNIPVYRDGHLYAYSSRFLTCVDVTTGEAKWRSRPPGDGFTTLAGPLLIMATKDGGIHVAEASPDGYNELAQIAVFDDLIWCPPSFAYGSIFVRGLGELARVDLVDHPTATPDAHSSADGAPGSSFAEFLQRLERSEDKSREIDQFLAAQSRFPIVENGRIVHFVYRGTGTDLAVGSDLFGARQEARMTRVAGSDLFYLTTDVEPDARISYIFLRDYQDMPDPRNPQRVTSMIYGREMEVGSQRPPAPFEMSELRMPAYRPPDFLTPLADAAQRGAIEDVSGGPEGVTLKAYLPTGYAGGTNRYPVVYVIGGKLALEAGHWDVALDNLIARKRIQPVIAVFVDLPPGAFATAAADLLATTITPLIDRQYRTQVERESRACVGTGSASAVAICAAVTRPELFGKLGVQSAFILDFLREHIDPLVMASGDPKLRVFIEWSRYDLRNPHEAWDMGAITRDYDRMLRARGHDVTGGPFNDGAGWPGWRSRIDRLLGALFPSETQPD